MSNTSSQTRRDRTFRGDRRRAQPEGDVGPSVGHLRHQALEGKVLQVDEVVEDEYLEFEVVVLLMSVSPSWGFVV